MRFIVSAIITIITVFANTVVFASNVQHAIVIDAGSSGSRLHLFQYEQNGKMPLIEDIFSTQVKPGLSAYADEPTQAAASLKKLLDDAQTELAKRGIDPHTVSINILATAGMRLLPEKKANNIYQAIKVFLQQHYAFMIGSITTVPEQLEGVYGWLDVNYLVGNFNDPAKDTVGIIDMGGASTEIAFATRDTSRASETIPVTINGKTYTVYSKNFLGLGQDQARGKMNTAMQANTCYPINYPLTPTNPGSFNLATCSYLYADIIEQHRVAQQMIPISAQQRFIAYSGVYHDYHFLDTHYRFLNNDIATQANVEKSIQQVCTQSWDQLKAANDHLPSKDKTSEEYLKNYCANSVFVSRLLFNTYQLQDGQLAVKNKINGKDIDWTLGALLYKLSQQAHEADNKKSLPSIIVLKILDRLPFNPKNRH